METASLADLCESITDCPHSTPVWTDSGVVVLRNQNIRAGRLDLSQPSYTSEEQFTLRTRRAIPRAGDLVITREAPMGEVCMIPLDVRCCLGQRMVLLRPDPKTADPRYLLYALQSPGVQEEIRRSEGTGSTVSNLRISLLERLRIPVCPPAEQRAIASALGALDAKVDLNRKTAGTLELLAVTLFGRTLHETRRTGGLEAALAEHIAVGRGLSYTGAGLGSGLPLHNLNSIREGGGYKREGIKYYSGDYKERHLVRPGDIVVANTEQAHTNTLIGYPAIVPARFGEAGLFSQDLFRVRIKDGSPLTPAFVYLLLRSEPLRSIVAGYRNGTTVSHLPSEALARPTFPLPSPERIRALDAEATPLLAKIEANEDESETLAALRDALLPRLISGELRVKPDGPTAAAAVVA